MASPLRSCVYAALIATIIVVGCSSTPAVNQAFPPPKLPPDVEQKRRYQAEQAQQVAFEREMLERAVQLRAELAAHPKKQTGRKVIATRCGQYFLYYDFEFINSGTFFRQLFYLPAVRNSGVPFGFTVSYTPPDAEVEWIDEVETGTYSLPHGKQLYVHSHGRKIPRAKVVPVPFYDSQSYHDEIYIRGVLYGEGEAYEYVE